MIKVIKSGFYSSIQDLGRVHFQDYGVPFSGVMDKRSALLVNALLGNAEDAAVLEITMTGPELKFTIDTCFAISGADMSPKLNGIAIPLNKIICVRSQDVLSFGSLKSGFRCYLAVLGGFNTEKVLESRSMHQSITKRLKINNNDELGVFNSAVSLKNQYSSVKFDRSYLNSNVIEVYPGPEFECLTGNQKELLFSKLFTVSKNHSRMAYQLEEPIENTIKPIITSAVLPGTVQLTPSGNLIILMRDCQTTGGYPRILQLKESSIDVLSQKYTGKQLVFTLVDGC